MSIAYSVKEILAVAVTVSQLISGNPADVKPAFNPETDQEQVTELIHQACGSVYQELKLDNDKADILLNFVADYFNREKLRLEQPNAGEPSFFFRILNRYQILELKKAFAQFCKKEAVESPIPIVEVIEYYNLVLKDLKDVKTIWTYRKEATQILDTHGKPYLEIYQNDNRRRWVKIDELPEHVAQAFVAAEDQNFFNHKGLDLRGIIRASMSVAQNPNSRPQGGSTITQQVIKNTFLNGDITVDRKIKEMVLAARLERFLSKKEILEFYINYVYLGRSSWGIEMAAQSYFGKSARQLDVNEAALLAALAKGPHYYDPILKAERARDRRQYVLNRMQEDKYITSELFQSIAEKDVTVIPAEDPRVKVGFIVNEINRAAERAGIKSLTESSYTVHSTINPELQKTTNEAIREALMQYEWSTRRVKYRRSLKEQDSLVKLMTERKLTWQEALPRARSTSWDLPYTLAVVLETPYNSRNFKVGLADGRTMIVANEPLNGSPRPAATPRNYSGAKLYSLFNANNLKVYDLVRVKPVPRSNTLVSIVLPPEVQGAAVVLENKTGRVLSMTGGFSYPSASQYNLVVKAKRSAGSTLKPFMYLAALHLGYQPNTVIADRAFSFPGIERGAPRWSVGNYNGRHLGLVTLRRALELSLNVASASLMYNLGPSPSDGLDELIATLQAFKIYDTVRRRPSILLGTKGVSVLDMAVAYATLANFGEMPTPHFFDVIEKDGKVVAERPRNDLKLMDRFKDPTTGKPDRVAFYQLRRILEGAIEFGTGTRLKDLKGVVAGKTGTSQNHKDAWFFSFTKDVTVAVWFGYPNKERSLGSGATGGSLAAPVAKTIINKTFELIAPQEPLPGPPDDIRQEIVNTTINRRTGAFVANGDFVETFRAGPRGGPIDTRDYLLSQKPDNQPGPDLLAQINNPNIYGTYAEGVDLDSLEDSQAAYRDNDGNENEEDGEETENYPNANSQPRQNHYQPGDFDESDRRYRNYGTYDPWGASPSTRPNNPYGSPWPRY